MKKNIVKVGQPLPQKVQSPVSKLQSTKISLPSRTLSTLGKVSLFLVWSFLACGSGYYFGTGSQEKYAEIDILKAQLAESERISAEKNQQMKHYMNARLKFLVERLEKKISQESQVNNQHQDFMKQQKVIESLQNEIDYLKQKKRMPASVQKDISNESMTYNSKNLDIMRYKQIVKLKKLKKIQRKREELFLDSVDLSNPEHKEAFEQMQEKHKLELYVLKRTYSEQRFQFQKNKYHQAKNI